FHTDIQLRDELCPRQHRLVYFWRRCYCLVQVPETSSSGHMHTRDRDVPLQTGDPPFILLFVRRLQVTHLGGSNTLEMIEPVLRAIVFEPPAKIAKIVRFRYCIGSRNFLSDFIK
ncbi:hypothetical protein AAVH_33207, partial [Aphelenchoides avenae]